MLEDSFQLQEHRCRDPDRAAACAEAVPSTIFRCAQITIIMITRVTIMIKIVTIIIIIVIIIMIML